MKNFIGSFVILAFSIGAIVFPVNKVHAATENFDSYSNGSNLDTLNGGSGWAGAWTHGSESAGAFTIDNSQSISSPNSVAFSTSAQTIGVTYGRQFASAISTGTFYVSWMIGASPSNVRDVSLGPNGTGNFIILQRNNNGYMQYFNGATYSNLFAWTSDTWYRIGIQWDNANHPNQARFDASSIGGTEGDIAPWTAWTNVNGNFSDINFVGMYNPGTGQTNPDWIDDISAYTTYPPITGSGTINRLAKFTAPNTIGDSLLSDDGSNVGIGTTTPGSLFSIGNIANFTSATSSFYGGGINLFSGCFSISGLCIGGGGTASSSGVSSIAQTYGTGQAGVLVFATSSTAFNGLSVNHKITNSGTAFTFSSFLSGILGVVGGGTGASSLTGLLQGNGTSSISAVTGISGQFPYYNGTNTLAATSSISISTGGFVSIGTTTATKILNLGTDTRSATGSTTIMMGKIQFDGYNSAGVRRCVFLNGSNTLTSSAGACK